MVGPPGLVGTLGPLFVRVVLGTELWYSVRVVCVNDRTPTPSSVPEPIPLPLPETSCWIPAPVVVVSLSLKNRQGQVLQKDLGSVGSFSP